MRATSFGKLNLEKEAEIKRADGTGHKATLQICISEDAVATERNPYLNELDREARNVGVFYPRQSGF